MSELNKTLFDTLERTRIKSGFSSRDIAGILNITESYLVHMRRELHVSNRLRGSIELLSTALEKEYKELDGPIYQARSHSTAESNQAYKRHVIFKFTDKYQLFDI